ncbi:MAG: M20 family metallopeptidase [Candidatus Azobacteroides sp.]|nr:M20 family metallopeptidase [Candidatus Azobacteroides sp.]
MNAENKIKQEVETIYPEIIEIYRHLHQYPELSYHEKKTSGFIRDFLDNENIPYRSDIGGYGILARIEGKNPSSGTIALRADMDALPIGEENDIPYKSQNEGIMHACGHDTHIASLLGTAKILKNMRDEFSGTILLIFQPGEEQHPGGALLMLEDHIFEGCEPELIIAQHSFMDLPCGTVGFRSGTVMASADEVHLVMKGKGGHAAMPHLLNDTVLAASQLIVSMQQVVSRRSNPFKPMVLSFGKFIAAGATNIIPNEVYISGTLRCMDEEERAKAKESILETAAGTAKAYGCVCDIEIKHGYPTVVNHPEITEKAARFAEEFLGKEKVVEYPVRMTSEDFGFFSQKYPSVFYRFGVRGKNNLSNGSLHTPTFLIDEEALKTSVGTLAYIAVQFSA